MAADSPASDDATKQPCLYPLPDGRRCCECDTCQGHDRLAANEYGPTPEELEERIFSILRRYPVEPDDAREVGGAVETLVEYANRSLTDAQP